MRSSLLSTTKSAQVGTKVLRSSLGMYDVYAVKQDGPIYMHTGQRTRPPSGGASEVGLTVDGATVARKVVSPFTTLFRNKAGKDVIGFQAVQLSGTVSAGEDGTIVSYEDKYVYYLGKADVSVPKAAEKFL